MLSSVRKKHTHSGDCHENHGQSSPSTASEEKKQHEHSGECHENHGPSSVPAGNIAIIETSQPMLANPKKVFFKIEGMCCASEIESLKRVVNPLLRGREAFLTFDLINAKLILESKYDNLPFKDEIIKAVAKTGMTATLWSDHVKQEKEEKTFWQRYGHIAMNVASAVSLAVGFITHAVQNGITTAFSDGAKGADNERPDYPPITSMVFYSTAIVTAGWFIFPKALSSIKRLRPDTNLLMVTAATGAIAINQWFEASTLMYLFSASELLESWNVGRARKAIRALMELAPSTAQVINEEGVIAEELVEQIAVGATITVRPGERIPMDSVLTLGTTFVNQAPITGESLPVQKEIGDVLFAGTINGDSAIQCRVTKAASDSTLASIIRKVEEAQSRRAKSEQWTEKFARYYVPSMMGASVVVAIVPPLAGASWYPWVYKGLEFLVISCPCSLVISTPVSIVAGLTAAARSGVLIKGGIYLEMPAYIKAFAMDKTGTITNGDPVVQNIIPMNGYNAEELLKLALALEIHSDHPLARAIQRKAKADGIIVDQPAESFQVFKGKGAEGVIDGKLFWIGSHRFSHEKIGDNEPAAVHDKIQALEDEGHSTVLIGQGQEICGLISIADTIRAECKSALQALKQAKIKRVVMLTGDNEGAAKAIAESIGLDEYHAELLPEDKVKQIESLMAKYKQVAMVGDGINDAPAMAASSLGIAMGAAGSDAAIETADIALMADDLSKLAWLVNHSRHTLNIIKQNVVFSLAVKSAFIGLTFANKASLWMAIAADMGASFIVVSNALRLLNNRDETGKQERATTQATTQIQPIPTIERRPSPIMLNQFARTQAASPRLLNQVSSNVELVSHSHDGHGPSNGSSSSIAQRDIVVSLVTAQENKEQGGIAPQQGIVPSPSLVLQFDQSRRQSEEEEVRIPTIHLDPEQQTEQPKKACCKSCK